MKVNKNTRSYISMFSVYEEVKHKKRKEHIPSTTQVQKLLQIKNLYDKFGTLQKVADYLHITRERVRQQLNKGQEYRLFQYKLTRERNLSALIQNISRDELLMEIKNGVNSFNICSKFNIDMNGYFKLLNFYQIDIQDYKIEALQKKYLIKYSNIVDELGHHPSTTEMQHTKKSWRYTGLAIKRIWGNIDRFRREYGIEKPPYHINPNTKLAWQKRIATQKEKSREKTENIRKIIASKGPISLKNMANALQYNQRTVNVYLHKLLNDKLIKRAIDADGITYKYFI